MVILLIATSAVVLVCSIPLVVRVFVNQLTRPEVVQDLAKNPDLLAIRIASVNPILDPWVYILLHKSVLTKLLEKIKWLFCKLRLRTPPPSTQSLSFLQRHSSALSSRAPSVLFRQAEANEALSLSHAPGQGQPFLTEVGGGGDPQAGQAAEGTAQSLDVGGKAPSALQVTFTDETGGRLPERCI
eukprot:gi/632989977/ref/XP_007883936.1/ PREDICTED: prostaglandin E2 receptor EP4 subtype-like [Callorhinchus milii]